jgi:hypothetical protein
MVVASGLAGTTAADVDGNVAVGFGISAGPVDSTAAACPLSVPSGADGISVLEAAVLNGCIESYETFRSASPPNHILVRCINGVCRESESLNPLSWPPCWSDRRWLSEALDAFRATDGGELVVRLYWSIVCHPV